MYSLPESSLVQGELTPEMTEGQPSQKCHKSGHFTDLPPRKQSLRRSRATSALRIKSLF